jgi:hypothetical protein
METSPKSKEPIRQIEDGFEMMARKSAASHASSVMLGSAQDG